MQNFTTLKCDIDQKCVARIVLMRGHVHNAFNATMVSELKDLFTKLSCISTLRLVTIEGEGKSFCAGADLEWMKQSKNLTTEENFHDAMEMSEMFECMDKIEVPIIAKIHGYVLGGGVGLVALCDYVLASSNTKLGLSEIQLGLVPAVISPYVFRKIGYANTVALMLTAIKIDAHKMMQMGLVQEVTDDDKRFEDLIEQCLLTAPNASRVAKRLGKNPLEKNELCKLIAELRVGSEAQEGMSALLEKRKANWNVLP